ncbi:putative Late nodulin [Medicago truncatula]|uniref:Nodule Cysteine-Rich (NCR) secreted peptide n=1 Tax=Medicago truncatula TaxID=3880 RepID=G7J1T4_MEDTR|nr:Nodule Cysteine-Rich (NCR) secreted peptide [Medicago truncatula]RHN66138.1 putative Late nodulin [Medicago truncatula]
MAEIFKVFYTLIIFASLYYVVALVQNECVTDGDCRRLYPHLIPRYPMCNEGTCVCIFE